MNSATAFRRTFYIFIPLYVSFLFPFPSKIIGYSMALWLNDLILIGYMAFLILFLKMKVPKTGTVTFLIIMMFLNLIGIATAILSGNLTSLRVISELARTAEFFVIYVFFINAFYWIKKKEYSLEQLLSSHLFKIFVVVSLISCVELFNLPLKEGLRSVYEMSKSGNIYQYYNRIVGTLRNPNFFGLWLSIIILFFFNVRVELLKKMIIILISGIFLFFTGSRTAMVAFIIAWLITAFFQWGGPKKLKESPLLLATFLSICVYFLFDNFQNLFYSVRLSFDSQTWSTLGGRLEIWTKYYTEIMKSPIFGLGIQKSDDIVFDNTFLQYTFYYGIFGFAFLLLFLTRNIFYNLKFMLKKKSESLLFFFFSVQVVFTISTLTVQILDVLQVSIFYFMGLAYLDALTIIEKRSKVS